jgi:hypothetical protein
MFDASTVDTIKECKKSICLMADRDTESPLTLSSRWLPNFRSYESQLKSGQRATQQ